MKRSSHQSRKDYLSSGRQQVGGRRFGGILGGDGVGNILRCWAARLRLSRGGGDASDLTINLD
jgi:hypothetical protein